jgi:hypothetical protein
MAFLRFTRDKRGYEYFYLVQPATRRGKSAARLLYWFRTPPNVKVGREPFDEAIRRELEAGNPDVTFDWRKILDTPIPSADAEKWRDRRRAERAARAARRGAAQGPTIGIEKSVDQEAAADEPVATDEDVAIDEEASADAPVHVLEAAAEAVGVSGDSVADTAHVPDLSALGTSNEHADSSTTPTSAARGTPDLRAVGSAEHSRRKRRRRRRRRGRSGPAGPAGAPPAGTGGDV